MSRVFTGCVLTKVWEIKYFAGTQHHIVVDVERQSIQRWKHLTVAP